MSKGLSIASAVSSIADASARAKAAKAAARQQNLQREYRSQMSDIRDKGEITDFNQRERMRQIQNQAAIKAEGAKGYQAQQAADYLRPRVSTGLGTYTPGFESRLMADVSTTPVNPLTGGTPWANALAAQQAAVRGERTLDAKDMAALSAGQRRAVEDQEAMGRMGATQQGEPARTAAISTDAGVAGEQVDHAAAKQKRGFLEDKQTVGTAYEPWIETDIITKEGSLGGIAKSMKDLMESGSTGTIKTPVGRIGGAYTSPAAASTLTGTPGSTWGGTMGAKGSYGWGGSY